ncbi:MAG: hypothetical protein ACI87E_002102 [Mariniblastus sp.]|jgi:hypothetical protein
MLPLANRSGSFSKACLGERGVVPAAGYALEQATTLRLGKVAPLHYPVGFVILSADGGPDFRLL